MKPGMPMGLGSACNLAFQCLRNVFLKGGNYYYSDMVRLIDEEMIVIEKMFCYSQVSRGGGM